MGACQYLTGAMIVFLEIRRRAALPPPPPPPPPKPPRPHGRFLDDGSELLWGDEARSVEELRAARAPR